VLYHEIQNFHALGFYTCMHLAIALNKYTGSLELYFALPIDPSLIESGQPQTPKHLVECSCWSMQKSKIQVLDRK
jgi:hypothetical protein